MDRQRLNADPDQDPTFQFDADTDPNPDPDPTPTFTHVEKSEFFKTFIHISAMQSTLFYLSH
jgi:hypothetical protein